jgi:hypothetical protein
VVWLFVGCASLALAPTDPLPSWNDGTVKASLVDFVRRATMAGGAEFVPPAARIAVFDNDGTLWSEQPIYFQFAFALDRVRARAPAPRVEDDAALPSRAGGRCQDPGRDR